MEQHILAEALPSFRKAQARGNWTEATAPLNEIRAIGLLRNDADQVRIWNIFSERDRLSFCGDVLNMLKGLVPYPIPAVAVQWPTAIMANDDDDDDINNIERVMHVNVHDGGGHDHFCVDLPEWLRRAELNTDWSQISEFAGSPSPEITRMLDQVCLGSTSLSTAGDSRPFPAPFALGIEKMPWKEVGHLCTLFPVPIAVHILRDWGLIIRGALSTLPHHIMVALQQGGTRVHVPRHVLRAAYERSTLGWMLQRYGTDRLCT